MRVIGIDAGATWVKGALLGPDMTCESKVKVASGAADGWEPYVASIKRVLGELDVQPDECAVGLALPAVFQGGGGKIRYFCNVKGFDFQNDKTVNGLFGEALGAGRLAADNDAGCAALAEWQRGGGKAGQAWLHVTWGTGIGSGLVTGGRVQPGWEAGHIPVTWERGDVQCGCGSAQDLESYASVPAMVKRAYAKLLSGEVDSSLKEEDFADRKETSRKLLELAEQGDGLAADVVNDALRWLARGLHQMAVIAMPDVVSVGGAPFENGWAVDRLKELVVEETSGFLSQSLRPEMIRKGRLGNDAGMVGAAMLF